MHDVTLLKKLGDKKLFLRTYPYIKEHAVSKETWKLLTNLNKYYRSYPDVDVVNWSEFKTFFQTIVKFKEDEHKIYDLYFKKIDEEDVESSVIDDVLKNYITRDYATQMFNVARAVAEGNDEHNIDEIHTIYSTYTREIGGAIIKDDLFVPTSLKQTIGDCASEGLNWRLNELNKSAGPLRIGDFVVVAARPETGKTTFIAAELTHFATQMKDATRPIVWINNEERSSKVMSRVIQAHFGTTLSDMLTNQDEYDKRYAEEIGGRIRIINDDMGLNDVRKLNSLFEEVNPSLIVFDQLDKVQGFYKESRDDLRLGKLYEWARDLAKKFGPCIAVSQASEQADYVNYIPLSLLRGSKTDKAGEADLIITIGKDKEEEYKRYIHVPKNKLWGGKMSEEALRHGKFEVMIKPEIARYIGVF